MVYIDTSFLVPFYVSEPRSEHVESTILTAALGSMVISKWTQVEFACAIKRLERSSIIGADQAVQAIEEFKSDIIESFEVVVPDVEDYEHAERTILGGQKALRGGDALHLAIALGGEADAIWTLDERLSEAAEEAGLVVVS